MYSFLYITGLFEPALRIYISPPQQKKKINLIGLITIVVENWLPFRLVWLFVRYKEHKVAWMNFIFMKSEFLDSVILLSFGHGNLTNQTAFTRSRPTDDTPDR